VNNFVPEASLNKNKNKNDTTQRLKVCPAYST